MKREKLEELYRTTIQANCLANQINKDLCSGSTITIKRNNQVSDRYNDLDRIVDHIGALVLLLMIDHGFKDEKLDSLKTEEKEEFEKFYEDGRGILINQEFLKSLHEEQPNRAPLEEYLTRKNPR